MTAFNNAHRLLLGGRHRVRLGWSACNYERDLAGGTLHVVVPCSVPAWCAAASTGMLQLCLMIAASHAHGASFLAIVDVVPLSKFHHTHVVCYKETQ